MIHKTLFKASLSLMATPFISLAATPAFSASLNSQQKLPSGQWSASNSRNSELIASWYHQDRDHDRYYHDSDNGRDRRHWEQYRHDRDADYDRDHRHGEQYRHDRDADNGRDRRHWEQYRHRRSGLTIIFP